MYANRRRPGAFIISRLAVGLLKGVRSTREFRQKVFARIDAEQLAEKDLILAGYLTDQLAAESEAGQKLQVDFAEAEDQLAIMRLRHSLGSDLRWMIREAEAIKIQIQREALEYVTKTLEIVNE